MTPEEWQRVRPILESALDLQVAERPAFLDAACPDSSLRQEVESLLGSHEQADTSVLNSVSPARVKFEEETRYRLPAGKRIGAYEILEEIATGGMGAVHRAIRADGEYRQQVALKIVRAELGGEFTAARFKNERQILASLDHPNIAKILDGGTTSEGVPYLVMELIEGLPITEYCDEHKLSLDARLDLFRTVCSAVHYAHQHLVIHRDIKPANILITAEGMPKLLDFGIAKILDPSLPPENTTMTAAGSWLMTPEYASPEQFRGGAITTATDVYSLGLVLYELLTGHHAFHLTSRMPHEIARLICEQDPERPSAAIRRTEPIDREGQVSDPVGPDVISRARRETIHKLRRRLTGDLDNIVMKAIRKEPGDRYSSADQLSEDLRRRLEGLPVRARKNALSYRLWKYVSRHKVGVTAVALVFLTLVGGLVATVREARIARAERARAERRFNDVRALANSLIFEIHDGIQDLPGSTPVRALLVERALQYLDSLSQESAGDFSLQRELAAAYDRVGDVQWSTDYANRGDIAGALHSYHKAIAIRESLVAANPSNLSDQAALDRDYVRLFNPLESTGDYRGALETVRKAVSITEAIGDRTNDFNVRVAQGGSYYFLARMLNESGDYPGALEAYRKAATIQETTKTPIPSDAVSLRTHLAGDYAGMAEAMLLLGNVNGGIEIQAKAIQILEDLSQSNPSSSSLRGFLANSYSLYADLLEKQSDRLKALEYRRRSHAIYRQMRNSDPQNDLARINFAFTDQDLGQSLISLGDVPEGMRRIHEGLAVFEIMAAKNPKNRYASSGLADCYFGLGLAYSKLASTARSNSVQKENWNEARRWFQKSADIWSDKRRHGALESRERETAERVTQGLAKCNAALPESAATERAQKQ